MKRTAQVRAVALGLAVLTFGFGLSAVAAQPTAPRASAVICPTQFTNTGCQKCCLAGGTEVYHWDAASGNCTCGF